MGRLKLNRVGETSVQKAHNLGMKIIAYRNACDIDIQFEDGVILQHKDYNSFKKGEIKHPDYKKGSIKKDYTGLEAVNGEGKLMKVIKSDGCMDLTIQFESGTIREHVTYNTFCKGAVREHNALEEYKELADSRLGISIMANNGQRMKIVKYNNSRDIDVQFEDGTIVKNKKWQAFVKGAIHNPNAVNHVTKHNMRNERIGETSVANNGMHMEIIAYRNANDVDIRFEDGLIVTHKKYRHFQLGNIRYKK